MSSNCTFYDKVIKGGCEKHWHEEYRIGFWILITSIIIAIILFVGIYLFQNSPEYIKQQQELENMKSWGCNDIKYRINEIVKIPYIKRTIFEHKVLNYLQERAPWSCDANIMVVGDK